jgi:hypothetical protein
MGQREGAHEQHCETEDEHAAAEAAICEANAERSQLLLLLHTCAANVPSVIDTRA